MPWHCLLIATFPSILKLQYNRLFVSAAQFPFDYVISSAVFEKLLDKWIKSCELCATKTRFEDICESLHNFMHTF